MSRLSSRMAALACAAALLICTASCDSSDSADPAESSGSSGFTFSVDSLSAAPSFISLKEGSQDMELIALKDSGGDIRIAYNTCQSCAGSPYAYFELEGDVLRCQNCGQTFDLATIGAVSGGCNPKPVSDYSTDGSEITIPESELKAAAPEFENWKQF